MQTTYKTSQYLWTAGELWSELLCVQSLLKIVIYLCAVPYVCVLCISLALMSQKGCLFLHHGAGLGQSIIDFWQRSYVQIGFNISITCIITRLLSGVFFSRCRCWASPYPETLYCVLIKSSHYSCFFFFYLLLSSVTIWTINDFTLLSTLLGLHSSKICAHTSSVQLSQRVVNNACMC